MISSYDEYKYSGVPVLGKIPSGWHLKKAKYLFREINEKSVDGTELLLSVSEYYGVKPRVESLDENELVTRAETLEGYKKCQEDDFVMNIMLAWKCGHGVTSYNGIVSPAYSVYRPDVKQILPKYVHYLSRIPMYTNYFKMYSAGIIDSRLRLYPDKFGSLFYVLPSIEEQAKIVAFLDLQITHLDRLIHEKKGFIKLLQERRHALISYYVTNGLNPNSEMKESGVEWIGQVPEHWKITKLRYVGTCQNGISIGGEFFGSGYPFINYGDVYKNRVLPENASGLVQSSENDRIAYSIKAGDVLFTRTSETIEEIGFSSVCKKDVADGVFAGFLIRFRPQAKIIDQDFSTYYFQNIRLRAFFVKEMNLVTRASLSQELLKRMPVLLPPIDEQKEISNYLDEKTSAIDELIGETNRSIEFLKERRAALISAAVTGKIDVRDNI